MENSEFVAGYYFKPSTAWMKRNLPTMLQRSAGNTIMDVVENMMTVYIYICVCVMYENRMMIITHFPGALKSSSSCMCYLHLSCKFVFRFKSKPLSFQIERENQLSTVTLWSRRHDVKLTLFASAASSALLQLFSCMSCETGPSLQRAR